MRFYFLDYICFITALSCNFCVCNLQVTCAKICLGGQWAKPILYWQTEALCPQHFFRMLTNLSLGVEFRPALGQPLRSHNSERIRHNRTCMASELRFCTEPNHKKKRAPQREHATNAWHYPSSHTLLLILGGCRNKSYLKKVSSRTFALRLTLTSGAEVHYLLLCFYLSTSPLVCERHSFHRMF